MHLDQNPSLNLQSFNDFPHCTGLWKILGANWSSWRRGGRIWQTLVILNWNMTNSHYFELKWIPTFTCRKFLECNTSISLDCADGWALENEIIYLYFDLSKTSVLNLVIHFFKEWNQLLRNFLKPYLPRPFPAYYGINVKSNFSGVDASCQNISFNMIYLALQI